MRSTGSFLVDKVAPQANGESSKIKVKVRVNIHGIFLVSSASMVEKLEPGQDDKEEAMDVDNGPITDKSNKEADGGSPNEKVKGSPVTPASEEGKENAAADTEKKEDGEVSFRLATAASGALC